MKEQLQVCRNLINKIREEHLPIRAFLKRYASCFEGIPMGSLIAPENQERDHYSERSYVFLIGSYVYCLLEGKSVTWFERRRHAKFERNAAFYRHSICADPKQRFQTLAELEGCLETIE